MELVASPPGSLGEYVFVVVAARSGDDWLLCRHRERSTWEMPGGHVEPGESPRDAAERELWEETGADALTLQAICDYTVDGVPGKLFVAEVDGPGDLPESEIAEARLFHELPSALTYPEVVPFLVEQVRSHPTDPTHSGVLTS